MNVYYTHKYLDRYYQQGKKVTARYNRLIATKDFRPGFSAPWRREQHAHERKAWAYTTLFCIKKHVPGMDFINEDETRNMLFAYLDRHGIHYHEGENMYGRTAIAMDLIDNKLEPFCRRLYDDIMWCDTTIICEHCYKLIDSEPGYYGDMLDYVIINDCEAICRHCLTENPEWLIDDCLGNYRKCVPSYFIGHIEDQGFEKFFEYDGENGFPRGQDDTPEKMLETVQERVDGQFEFIFAVTDKGQFDVHFNIWVKRETEQETD